jgi:hypothetical protein
MICPNTGHYPREELLHRDRPLGPIRWLETPATRLIFQHRLSDHTRRGRDKCHPMTFWDMSSRVPTTLLITYLASKRVRKSRRTGASRLTESQPITVHGTQQIWPPAAHNTRAPHLRHRKILSPGYRRYVSVFAERVSQGSYGLDIDARQQCNRLAIRHPIGREDSDSESRCVLIN